MIKKLLDKYKALPIGLKVSFWFVFCSFFQRGISVLTSPFFNRLLTVDEYGLYSVYLSWNGIFSVIASLSLSSGFVSVGLSNEQDKEKRNKLISSIQGLATIVSCVFLSLFLIFHTWIEQVTSLPFIVLLFMFVSYVFQNSFNLCITKDKFNGKCLRMLITTVIATLLSPVITFILLYNSDQKALIRILVPIIVVLCYELMYFSYNFVKGKKFFDKNIWKQALLFNLPLIPHYLANIVLASSDRIIIEKLVGLDEAGIYGLAYTIASLLSILINPIYVSTQPWFYRCISEKKYNEIRRVTAILTTGLTIVLVFAILLGPELIWLFGSEKYASAQSCLPVLFAGEFLLAFYVQFTQVEFKFKKTWPIMISSVISAVLNILLNYWLIPIYGYVAAAYTTLFCYFLYTIFHYVSQRIIVKTRIFNVPLYLILFAIVCAFAIFGPMIYSSLIVRLILLGLMSVGILVCIVLVVINRKTIIAMFKKDDSKAKAIESSEINENEIKEE